MKEKLEAWGWVCVPCGCPGKGYDCASRVYRGYVIKTSTSRFKIYKNSMIIESANGYELEEKLKVHGLYDIQN